MYASRSYIIEMCLSLAVICIVGFTFASANLVKPQPPEDFDCVFRDLKDLNCTWNKPKAQISNTVPTSWNVTFRWKPYGGSKFSDLASLCPNQTISNTAISCHWSCDNSKTCSFGQMRRYRVYIHGLNQLGNVSRMYDVIPENYAILSIQKLDLKPSNKSMLIIVHLQEHIYLSLVGRIVFQIEIHELQGAESELTNKTQWITEIQETYKKNIIDLKPFTGYKICVKTKLSESIGHWSNEVCGQDVTKEAVPTHAPETTKWAYYFEKESGRVRLYLKKIPTKYKTSENYNYFIQRLENGQVTTNITAKPNTTIEIPSSWIKDNDKFIVRIRSCNDLGCSDSSTHLNIDKAKTEFRPTGVTAMKNDESDMYTVSCDVREKFRKNTQFTIFYYCRGFRETHTCLSDFNWINKTGAILRQKIKVPSGQYGDWIFGVSLVANDYTSGGILFVSCYSTVNSSCEQVGVSELKELTVFPDEALVVVLIAITLTLLFGVPLLLRYLRKRYCQELRIDLPEIFQKKYRNDDIRSTLETDYISRTYTSSVNDQEGILIKCQEEQKNNGDHEMIFIKGSDSVCKDEKRRSLKLSFDSGVTDLNHAVHTPTSDCSSEQIMRNVTSQESLNSVFEQNNEESNDDNEMKPDLKKVVEDHKFSEEGETESLLPSGYAKMTYVQCNNDYCVTCGGTMTYCEEKEINDLERTAMNLTFDCRDKDCTETVELISGYV
ncbi:uncharacterized protein LOC134245503 isoform X2 [Saccostrea cucullata]|uniref:uncharacterized protein LOC134245503 isoform X2 n=1 Tax=Saccostrea cuccullata TaxID=36930 RepID=UPI002ECFC559